MIEDKRVASCEMLRIVKGEKWRKVEESGRKDMNHVSNLSMQQGLMALFPD
jgi:hypothetical protein